MDLEWIFFHIHVHVLIFAFYDTSDRNNKRKLLPMGQNTSHDTMDMHICTCITVNNLSGRLVF